MKIIQIAIFAALFAGSFAGIAAAGNGLPNIIVETISPQPIEPGKDLILGINLYNKLSTETGAFSAALDITDPILLKSVSDDLADINLCGGCGKRATYFLTISSMAISGTYPIYFREYSENVEQKQKIDIRIVGKPNIVLSTDTAGLNNITANAQFAMSVNAKNIGSGQARQVKIQADSADFVSIGGSVKSIGFIEPNGMESADFNFASSSLLTADVHSIPFKISYFDEQGNAINASQNLGIKVINKGKLDVQTIKVASSAGGPVTAGQPITIVVRIENVGFGDATNIAAQISCPFNGIKKAFLGRLQKDSDAPAVFDMTPPSAGNFVCDLNIAYEDDTGTHSINEKFDVAVAQGNTPLPVLAAALILAILFRKRLFGLLRKK